MLVIVIPATDKVFKPVIIYLFQYHILLFGIKVIFNGKMYPFLVSAVITWTWNGRLLSAGSMRVYDDNRIRVLNDGRELIIEGVTPEDRGEYSCTLNLEFNPLSLYHKVEVLGKP